ncbi:MAG: putative lipopolysaccharide heptosyltransferase III [Chthoniobacterales bacterium]
MNILLLQLKRIGDLILTTPAIAAVRERFPDAKIALAVAAGSRELLPAITDVDETLVAHGRITDAAGWFRVARRRYEYCFDFTRTDRSAFVTLLSRARSRVVADHPRFRGQMRSLTYNKLIDVPIGEMHTVDYHLALLEPVEVEHASQKLRLNLPAAALEAAGRVLANAGLAAGEFIVLHPGSARREKFWEPERWAALIAAAARYDLKCVVTGARSSLEQGHIAEIRSHSRHPFIDLAGQVDLLTLAALIQRARMLITVDSAPMHLAAASQTPQVALFGPTNPLHWRPRFTPAVILQAGQDSPVTAFTRKQKAAPMNRLSTEQVIDAMKSLLAVPETASSV